MLNSSDLAYEFINQINKHQWSYPDKYIETFFFERNKKWSNIKSKKRSHKKYQILGFFWCTPLC